MGASKAEGNFIWRPKHAEGRKKRKEDVQAHVKAVSLKREGKTFLLQIGKKENRFMLYGLILLEERCKHSISPLFHFIFHDAKIWVYM